MKALLEMKTNV